MPSATVVWLRQDLRLADNAALQTAAKSSQSVISVFILEDEAPLGGAARWWLHHSLAALGRSLAALGSPLVLRRGDALAELMDVARVTGARGVTWNRRYEPAGRAIDQRVEKGLARAGLEVRVHAGNLLAEPETVRTREGRHFRVFTPFDRALRTLGSPGAPLPAPSVLPPPPRPPASERLDDWGLLPHAPDWAAGFRNLWLPGERGARARIDAFLEERLRAYHRARDIPGEEGGTSRLSPHLHFGEMSARQVWHVVNHRMAERDATDAAGGAKLLRELAWREFCQHLLFHEPSMLEEPLQGAFARFPWREDHAALRAWQAGRTGYPIIDAGMRELWRTGWMHNRVRMIVASFLTKHLLIPWQAGAAWFLDTLVDADAANNAANWQWVAGCGADAAPYFRIFNPVLQGARFDAAGRYVRRFVPELARLPDAFIHKPWTAPRATLSAAGVRLGENYPEPIIEHGLARARALDAFRSLRAKSAQQSGTNPLPKHRSA